MIINRKNSSSLEASPSLPSSFAGAEYEDLVSIEQSIRTQIASHIDWAEDALRERIEVRYGASILNSHEGAIKKEAISRIEGIVRRISRDLAHKTTSPIARNHAQEQGNSDQAA